MITAAAGATQIDNQNTGENWVRDSECSCVQEPMNVAYDNQGLSQSDFYIFAVT